MRRDWNGKPDSVAWEDCFDVLRAEGWDIDLSDHGGALIQIDGHVPDGNPFYLRGKYDFVELDIGGADPPPGMWHDEVTQERAGDLTGAEAMPLIRELYGRYVRGKAAN